MTLCGRHEVCLETRCVRKLTPQWPAGTVDVGYKCAAEGLHLDEQVTESQAELCSGKHRVAGTREAGAEKESTWEATMHEFSRQVLRA